MHPKLFHAGGECTSAYNYRLHFYFGFGDSNDEIFDWTYFLPAKALSNAVGPRTEKAKAAKTVKRDKKGNSLANLKQGNKRPPVVKSARLKKFKHSKQK